MSSLLSYNVIEVLHPITKCHTIRALGVLELEKKVHRIVLKVLKSECKLKQSHYYIWIILYSRILMLFGEYLNALNAFKTIFQKIFGWRSKTILIHNKDVSPAIFSLKVRNIIIYDVYRRHNFLLFKSFNHKVN